MYLNIHSDYFYIYLIQKYLSHLEESEEIIAIPEEWVGRRSVNTLAARNFSAPLLPRRTVPAEFPLVFRSEEK